MNEFLGPFLYAGFWIFLIPLPIVLVGTAIGAALLPKEKRSARTLAKIFFLSFLIGGVIFITTGIFIDEASARFLDFRPFNTRLVYLWAAICYVLVPVLLCRRSSLRH